MNFFSRKMTHSFKKTLLILIISVFCFNGTPASFENKYSGITTIKTKLHKYYFSTTKVRYYTPTETLQWYTRIFTDDLEKLLEKRYGLTAIDFENLSEEQYKIIAQYFSQVLFFSTQTTKDSTQKQTNNTLLNSVLQDIESEGEFLYLYAHRKVSKAEIKKLRLTNKLLLGLYPEQYNHVDISVGKITKTVNLHKNKTSVMFYFDNQF